MPAKHLIAKAIRLGESSWAESALVVVIMIAASAAAAIAWYLRRDR